VHRPPADDHAVCPVGRHDLRGRDLLADELGDLVLAFLENGEQVVGEVDVAFVDLVDEQDPRALIRQQCRAERAEADIAPDVFVLAGRR